MNDDVAEMHVRQSRRRSPEVIGVGDFTMLVRVAGRPAATRVFTDAESNEAAQYAAETGGTVVPLPLAR